VGDRRGGAGGVRGGRAGPLARAFDVAVEAGSEATRATYGVSPGDADHDEPYAYVAPWTAPAATGPSTFWNAAAFTGAERPVADDVDELVAFFRAAAALLADAVA
jgi:hypothetical protein